MVEFNEDGSIKWSEDLLARKKEEPFICVLKALDEIPFSVGKKLLIDVLQGNDENKTVKKSKLNRLISFGVLSYSNEEILEVIDTLERDGFIVHKNDRYWKVLCLTIRGKEELKNPGFYRKEKKTYEETIFSEEDKLMFNNFDFFLNIFNDEQKKAIVSQKKVILCIAGAGTGKTTVLTKRIEFLLKFRDVDPKKVLAITFTRKARIEMQDRLSALGYSNVNVETFNSFSEKILRKYNNLIYGKEVRMMTYSDKIKILNAALESLSLSPRGAIEAYFKTQQLRSKSDEELYRIFLNDCYFIVDYFKSKGREMYDFSVDAKDVMSAKMMYGICKFIDEKMRSIGFRNHMDQIVDTIDFFEKHKDKIPEFDYVLVDEYQDVNDLQIKFIDLVCRDHLFCVGDPRQAIFGWRGSNISYIMDFKEKYPEAEIINLRNNYRSSKGIVDLSNETIRVMNLPDLESAVERENKIKLLNFKSDDVEFEFVIQSILAASVPKEEIFVLARTNKQLKDLSYLMLQRGIPHILKGDDMKKVIDASKGEVTLATVHAIKGLEANIVFVVGCTSMNFPCKATEHPVVDMIKVDEYDKEDEERRLFYVALSRAKEALYLSYSGKRHSSYITSNMKKMLGFKEPKAEKSWYQNRDLKDFVG
ncbi:MAG: exodeoxyribonuclease V subunit gamma [Nanoarchaeota archaeon]|nr:exodeoxyribonuclease V subunit gamma [Nanoarchaeota archaeon]